MPFLKQLGQIGLTAGKALLGAFLGAISEKVPPGAISPQDLFLGMVQKVVEAELAGARLSLSGEQKRQLAAIVVEQMILKSPLAHGKKLSDPTKFRATVEHLVGDVADILNNFEGGAVKDQDFA